MGAAPSEGAVVLDRVIASVGNRAITLSDVEQEYRLELFLNGQPPRPPDTSDLLGARKRLVYQELLALELAPEAPDREALQKAAAQRLAEIRRRFSSQEDYAKAVQALGLTESQMLEQMVLQARILRMIDQRFRPAAAPTPGEIEAYYRSTFVPEYERRQGGTPPALSEVEDQIREILVQENIDKLLAEWLDEVGPHRRVRFHPFGD